MRAQTWTAALAIVALMHFFVFTFGGSKKFKWPGKDVPGWGLHGFIMGKCLECESTDGRDERVNFIFFHFRVLDAPFFFFQFSFSYKI
jgi:hypothetical protein